MMKFETRKPELEATPRSHSRGGAKVSRFGFRSSGGAAARRGFTLIEVLLALGVLAILMVAVHAIFHSALQLRNKTDQVFEDALPLEHTLAVMERDLANLTLPGGTLSGAFQTTPTVGTAQGSAQGSTQGAAVSLGHSGQQCGPTFYTASGTLNDDLPWSEMRKVAYYLVPGSNGGAGLDLVRSVTRNLLPVLQEEYTDQRLMGGVSSLAFQFYNGTQWVDTWDSTTPDSSGSTNSLPQGIRAQLTLVTDDRGAVAQTPIELVVPVFVQPITNSTASTGGGQ
jgi:type II secretion system protein J